MAAAWEQLRISIMPWLGGGNVLVIHFVCVEQPPERILILSAHRDVAIKSSAHEHSPTPHCIELNWLIYSPLQWSNIVLRKDTSVGKSQGIYLKMPCCPASRYPLSTSRDLVELDSLLK